MLAAVKGRVQGNTVLIGIVLLFQAREGRM